MGKREAVLALLAGSLAGAMALGGPALPGEESFGPADRAIIGRNESLRRDVDRDPAAVRRALDTLAAKQMPGEGKPGARSREGSLDDLFDEATDPDLDRLERASPEAAYDLFQILKKASDSGTPPPPKQSR